LAYLPSAFDLSLPTVKSKIANVPDAKEFLKAIGLQEPDVVDDILKRVVPKYAGDEIGVSSEENARDVATIIEALKTVGQVRRTELIEALSDVPILLASDAACVDSFADPGSIYLGTAFTGDETLETYFTGNASALFLSEGYNASDA